MLKFKIRKCTDCGEYTLRKVCPDCKKNTVVAHPAKFSPDDKYLEYKVRTILKSRGFDV